MYEGRRASGIVDASPVPSDVKGSGPGLWLAYTMLLALVGCQTAVAWTSVLSQLDVKGSGLGLWLTYTVPPLVRPGLDLPRSPANLILTPDSARIGTPLSNEVRAADHFGCRDPSPATEVDCL